MPECPACPATCWPPLPLHHSTLPGCLPAEISQTPEHQGDQTICQRHAWHPAWHSMLTHSQDCKCSKSNSCLPRSQMAAMCSLPCLHTSFAQKGWGWGLGGGAHSGPGSTACFANGHTAQLVLPVVSRYEFWQLSMLWLWKVLTSD